MTLHQAEKSKSLQIGDNRGMNSIPNSQTPYLASKS